MSDRCVKMSCSNIFRCHQGDCLKHRKATKNWIIQGSPKNLQVSDQLFSIEMRHLKWVEHNFSHSFCTVLQTHQQLQRIWPIVSKRNAWQRPKWVKRQFLEQVVEVQHLIKWFAGFQMFESKLFSLGFIGQAGMAMFKIRLLCSEILIWQPSGSSKPFGLLLAWTSL